MTVFKEGMGRPPDRPPRRVLVTGANGFMGSHMADLLLRERVWPDARVTFTDLPGSKPPAQRKHFGGTTYAAADLRDPDDVESLMAHGPFTHVLHIAGLFDYAASLEDLRAANVTATANLLSALARQERKPQSVVVWGAGGVYDFSDVPANGVNEETRIAPSADYLRTKYEGEIEAMRIGAEHGIPVSVLRPGGVYGPRARYGVGVAIILAARGGMGPFFFGPKKNRAGTIHAEDVCRAGLFLAERPAETDQQFYNVNDDSSYTMYELFRTAAKRLGFPMLSVALPLGIMEGFVAYIERRAAKKGRVSMVNGDMVKLQAFDTLLDASKLKALGWRPRYPDALAGLMETIDWYEKEGWL